MKFIKNTSQNNSVEVHKTRKLKKNRNSKFFEICEVHGELHETSRTRNFKYNYNIKIKTYL